MPEGINRGWTGYELAECLCSGCPLVRPGRVTSEGLGLPEFVYRARRRARRGAPGREERGNLAARGRGTDRDRHKTKAATKELGTAAAAERCRRSV